MTPEQFWYLFTIILFAGGGNYILWKRNGWSLKKNWGFIVLFTLLAMPVAYLDHFALKWHAYQYNPAHTLNVRIFGAELETYIFLGGITCAVVGATMIYAKREEKGARLSSRHHQAAVVSPKRKKAKKPKARKLIPALSSGRR